MCILCCSDLCSAQHSLPYIKVGLMTVLYSFFFSLTGNFLSQISPDNPLREFHADRILLSTSAPHPPVASIVEPKYLNELVHGIGTPAKQTSSIDLAGLKYSVLSLLLYEPYANESSQICPFLAVQPQFECVHHQNRRLSSHSYSHESVILSYFWDSYFLSYGDLLFLGLTARVATAAVENRHRGSVHYITIGDSRLLTAAGLTRSPLYLLGDAASRRGLSQVGYVIPLNGRRPLNGHPPSFY